MPIGRGDVGRRVVVRHRLPDGRATDVLGELASLDAAAVSVRRPDGALVRVAAADVVAARAVPPSPARRAAGARVTVEDAARRSSPGWAAERVAELGDWQLRWYPGRMARGRSVLAVGDPGVCLDDAVLAVEEHYAVLGAEPALQVASPLPGAPADDAGRAAALEAVLGRRGWRPDPWSLFALGPAGGLDDARAGPGPTVHLAASASPAWLATSSRRGVPLEPADLPGAADGVQVAYASAVSDGAGQDGAGQDGAGQDGAVVAVARGAVAEGWLGLSSVHVLPAARRRGAARALAAALARWGADRGAAAAYVQVVEDNTAARELWAACGLLDHHRYRYWRPASPA